MNKKIKEYCNEIWNEEARKQLEVELNYVLKEKIELPKGKDYLTLFAETHKTEEEIIEEKDKEIDRLNNELDKTRLSELNKEYIIDELEKHLEENYIRWQRYEKTNIQDAWRMAVCKENLDKLKELKENTKNEI